MTVSIAVLGFIGWAGFTNINEVARTPGEIAPQGMAQLVQHLEGGLVREILVAEGETVARGDLLLRLDGTGIQEDLARARNRAVHLDLQEERLRAFIDGRAPDFSTFSGVEEASIRDQQALYDSSIAAWQKERHILRDQLQQKQQYLEAIESELQTAFSNFTITQDLYNRRRILNDQGYVSDIMLLETRQALNNYRGALRQLEHRIERARTEIGEFDNRLGSLDARYLSDARERLDSVMADQAENREILEKLRERRARLDVRAPVRGLVKGLAVNTVGGVVYAGQVLMEIVPLDEELIVQVRIPPQHIGHVRRGQAVNVKFSSFDFSRYGYVPGALEHISATTFRGEGGERYYMGRVQLQRHYVGDDPRNVVMPGMTVMADIITGRKTILDYLLKPVHLAVRTSFSER